MSPLTYFVALPIVRGEDGELLAGEGFEQRNAAQAIRGAATLASQHPGAVAFSRLGDPDLGEYEPAVILARYGELPDDVSRFVDP